VNAVIDIAKVADILLLVIPKEGIDSKGEQFISMIKAQGLPSVIGILQGLNTLPKKQNKQLKKQYTKWFQTTFNDEFKVLSLDTEEEGQQVVRFIANSKLRIINWREKRPYMLVQKFKFISNPNSQDGTLTVSGYLRGASLNVNNLVHIPDFGDFQLLKITGPLENPYKKKTWKKFNGDRGIKQY